MLTLDNISYKYSGRNQFALSNINLTVEPGTIFTLLGPNGAGKTTLVRILSGLIIPGEGCARICSHDTVKHEYEARKSFGLFLGDERTFYFRLSGKQNLEFFGGLLGIRRKQLKSRIDELLKLVGLQDADRLPFMKYSTGMRKRLNFARALLTDPPVYFLDEPNSGVDPESARHIRGTMLDLKKRGRTILLTTHNLEEAEKMSDIIGFLKEGTLLRVGPLSEFKREFMRRKIIVSFDHSVGGYSKGIEEVMAKIRRDVAFENLSLTDGRIEISFNGATSANRVLSIVAESPLRIAEASCQDATLEDVFLQLAGCDHV
jgi:ABC-2 type transport system ATP-binding protein